MLTVHCAYKKENAINSDFMFTFTTGLTFAGIRDHIETFVYYWNRN